MRDFNSAPEVPESAMKRAIGRFDDYLFFTRRSDGTRDYFCTACRKKFQEGEGVLKMLMTPEDWKLQRAPHKSRRICPECGTDCEVLNEKFSEGYVEAKFFAFFIPASREEIWVRCYAMEKGHGKVQMWELMRYCLERGSAQYWRRDWHYSDPFCKMNRYEEPFRWNSGLCHREYQYESIWTEGSVDDTFLKYSGWRGNANELFRHICWYAQHPQVEMLTKMGHRGVVDDLLFRNCENVSTVDWTKSRPWEFYRLSRSEYNVWEQKYKPKELGLKILKLYKRIGGNGEKGFETAKELLNVTRGMQDAIGVIARAKQMKVTVKEILRYVDRVSEETAKGRGCGCRYPTSRMQIMGTWLDYVDMVISLGLVKTANPTPKDLERAHRDAVKQFEVRKSELSIKERIARREEELRAAEREGAPLEKKYKVSKICKRIGKKYAYVGEKYAIVVPTSVAEIIYDSKVLMHCVARVERYYERMASGESYIVFLRKTENLDLPFYTLEIEPNGTVRQERTVNDTQDAELAETLPFIAEWQKIVKERMSDEDRRLAERSAEERRTNIADLRERRVEVRNGYLRGKLLADVLEADLLEVGFDIEKKEKEKKRA